MQKHTVQKRAQVLQCLMEGMSMASVIRLTGVAQNTIVGILRHVGDACAAFHREQAVGLDCDSVQLDEQWAFVGCREDHKPTAKRKHPGDTWTWTCMCADTKFMVNWRVGRRTLEEGVAFCKDLGERFSNPPQVNSDGLNIYRVAVPRGFGHCDFGQLIKFYKDTGKGRLEVVKVIKAARTGEPDMMKLSTSFAERQNLTTRMTNRRMTRLTNGYSKIESHHELMLNLTYFHYNWCRKHMTLGSTPAQAIGLTFYQWNWQDVVEMADKRQKAERDAEFENAFATKFNA